MASEKIVKVHCNKCSGETRHDVLHQEKVSWDQELNEGDWIDGADIYELLKCCGCETVALRHRAWFSEDTDEHGRPNVTTAFYPPASYRREPQWMADLFWALPIDNNFVKDFLKEIYVALRNDALRLAVMGIRALIEQVTVDKVGDHGDFRKNLDAFEKQGFVSSSQRAVLNPVIDAGHATMHWAFKPDARTVGRLMDITESIIESTYINNHRARQLPTVPPRAKKNPEKKPEEAG